MVKTYAETYIEGGGEDEGVYHYLGLAGAQLDKCESPRIVGVLISTLERIVQSRDDKKVHRRNQSNGDLSYDGAIKKKIQIFDGMRAPSIGIEGYVMRIFKYAKCSPCCFVLAYAYISKLSASLLGSFHHAEGSLQEGNIIIMSPLNVHRLLITSVLLSTKFMEDNHFNNAYFAKIGGISTAEMNGLEMAFLKVIRYRLHITLMEFERLCLQFAKEAAMQAAILVSPPLPQMQSHATLKACSYDEDYTISVLCTQ